jgi:glycerol-3-phosphate cytidylyltransferase
MRYYGIQRTVITFGTFDLFHIGHLRLLQRAKSKSFGGQLIVGVSSDALNFQKKQKYPIYSENDRLEIVKSIKCVDQVFLETSLELKPEYLLKYRADILIMGDDWKGKFEWCKSTKGLQYLQIYYLPRTESISTTDTIEKIIGTSYVS